MYELTHMNSHLSVLSFNTIFQLSITLDALPVSCMSVATSMITHCDTKNKAAILCEFLLNRTTIGRGGEHLFLRWDEAFFDYFYSTADFDWTLMKIAINDYIKRRT